MHDDDQDDDAPLTPQELRERYGFKPGEREQIEREMAERARRIALEQTLEWCAQRAEQPQPPSRHAEGPTDELGRPLNDPRYRLDPDMVAKAYPAAPRAAAAPAGSLSKAAARQVLATFGRPLTQEKLASLPPDVMDAVTDALMSGRDQSMVTAVGQVMGDVRRDTDATIEKLRLRIVELEGRLERLETPAKPATSSNLRAIG